MAQDPPHDGTLPYYSECTDMGAGLQIFSDSGFVQIDADYSNYVLVAKGTVTCGPRETGYGVDISSNRKNSIIAIRSGSFAAVFNSLDGASNVVHKIVSESNGAVIDYWIFAADPPAPTNNGFEVYNAQGQVVFSANGKYLKLLRFVTVPVGAGTSGSIQTPGIGPAWVSASFCALWEGATVAVPGGVQSHGILRTLMGRSQGDSAFYKSATIYDFPANRGTSDNAFASFFLVNVDNI